MIKDDHTINSTSASIGTRLLDLIDEAYGIFRTSCAGHAISKLIALAGCIVVVENPIAATTEIGVRRSSERACEGHLPVRTLSSICV